MYLHFYMALYLSLFDCVRNMMYKTVLTHTRPDKTNDLDFFFLTKSPGVVPSFRGGIAYLIDPDSYDGWSFYTPGRASQVRQVEG